MIPELVPVWKQFVETYNALRTSLGQFPEEALTRRLADHVPSPALIVQHVVNANALYAHLLCRTERQRRDYEEQPTRDQLLERLAESQQSIYETLEPMTAEDLRRTCADDWSPLSPEPRVEGPLDGLWFAMQMVRHSAYHLGQINLYLRLLEQE